MKHDEIDSSKKAIINVINQSSKFENTLFLIVFILNLIFLLFFGLFGFVLLLKPYSLRGYNIYDKYNDYCQNTTNKYYELLCTNKHYTIPYKKSKFIWIFTDGTAYDELVQLHNLDKYKITTSFKNLGENFKLTNELHDSIITGRRSKNYFGRNIKHDHIIRQLLKAGYKMNYRGWTEPIPSIIGENEGGIFDKKIFYKKFIDDDYEISAFNSFCNITNPFPFLNFDFETYQKSIPEKLISDSLVKKIKEIFNKNSDKYHHLLKNVSKEYFYNELDNLFKENPIDLFSVDINECLEKSFGWNKNEDISIIYYTTVLDHFNHLFGKNHVYDIAQAYITEKMIQNLINWINNNPDYALIITADHGGESFYGEDILRNHGEDIKDNEAIFIIYTKELADNYDKLKMIERYVNVQDESAIIPEILLNANIPIHSLGIPYQLINDNINAYIGIKMKEVQLIKIIKSFLEKYGNRYNELKNILEDLEESMDKINNYIENYFNNDDKKKEFEKLIQNNLEKVKEQQIKINKIIRKKIPDVTNILVFMIIAIITLAKVCLELTYLVKIIFNEYFKKLSYYQKNMKKYIITSIVTLFLFLLPFILMASFYFKLMFDRIVVFIVSSFLCTVVNIIIIYFIFIWKKISFNSKYTRRILNFIYIIFSLFYFTIIFHFTYCFFRIKEKLARTNLEMILSLVLIYPTFIIQICYEVFSKYKNLFFYFGKNSIISVIPIILTINTIFIIFTLIQDLTIDQYYNEGSSLNSSSVVISLAILVIFLIITYFPIFIKKNKIFVHNLDDSKNNTYDKYDRNLKNYIISQNNNEEVNTRTSSSTRNIIHKYKIDTNNFYNENQNLEFGLEYILIVFL